MTRRRTAQRLEPHDFAAARVLVDISATRVEAARLVLVEGHTAQAVANHFGVTRQAVASSVHVLLVAVERWRAAQHAADSEGPVVPRGWRSVRMLTPISAIPKLQRVIDAEAAVAPVPRLRRKAAA